VSLLTKDSISGDPDYLLEAENIFPSS
jgi:hypothetical protein